MASQGEREIEIQARVIALEYLVKRLLWIVIAKHVDSADGYGEDVISEARLLAGNLADELECFLPDSDPATSDHATALVRENVARVSKNCRNDEDETLGPAVFIKRGERGVAASALLKHLMRVVGMILTLCVAQPRRVSAMV